MDQIHSIIFDIGNVLLTFQPREFMQTLFQNREKGDACYSLLVQSPEWRELDSGRLPLENAKAIFQKRDPSLAAEVDLFFQHWLEMFHLIDESILLLDTLHERGYKLYILSNFIREAYFGLRSRMTFLDRFDGKVFSYEVGMAKPDLEIYEHLLHTFNISAHEAVFIDDMENNVQGAQAAGIHTILFKSPQQLREQLKTFGIL